MMDLHGQAGNLDFEVLWLMGKGEAISTLGREEDPKQNFFKNFIYSFILLLLCCFESLESNFHKFRWTILKIY